MDKLKWKKAEESFEMDSTAPIMRMPERTIRYAQWVEKGDYYITQQDLIESLPALID